MIIVSPLSAAIRMEQASRAGGMSGYPIVSPLSRAITMQRRYSGMGAADDTSATIAAVAADVHTVGDARATLGKTTELLADAYTRLSDITGSDNREAARELLDQANDYAQRVYADLPSVGLDDPIDATMAMRVGGAFGTTRRALARVEEAAGAVYWDYTGALRQVLTTTASAAGNAVQSVTNAVAASGAAFVSSAWPTLLLLTAGVALYVFGPRLLKGL